MTSLHRVLVVEDHAPFRGLICKLLRQQADLEIVGEAASFWGEAYELAVRELPVR